MLHFSVVIEQSNIVINYINNHAQPRLLIVIQHAVACPNHPHGIGNTNKINALKESISSRNRY